MAAFDTVASSDGLPTTVVPKGEIDLANVLEFSGALERAVAAAAPTGGTVTVDLTEVTYLDSAGLRALFQLAGTPLRVIVTEGGLPAGVVGVTGLDQIAEIVHSR